MRRQSSTAPPPPGTTAAPSGRRVNAREPNHLWHVDLTVVPTSLGLWASWLPFALPQCFPFCWWLAVALDHYSRRALGFAVLLRQPTSEQVRHFLGRIIRGIGTAPKYLVTDSGVQFTDAGFKLLIGLGLGYRSLAAQGRGRPHEGIARAKFLFVG